MLNFIQKVTFFLTEDRDDSSDEGDFPIESSSSTEGSSEDSDTEAIDNVQNINWTSRPAKDAGQLFNFTPDDLFVNPTTTNPLKAKRCHICGTVTRSYCDMCSRPICPNHRRMAKTCHCTSCS